MLEQSSISCFADEIDTHLDRQISLLQELHIHYLELRSAEHKNIADYSLIEAEALINRLKQNGISVSALGSPIGKMMITDAFQPHFEKFQHICELAEIADTPYIRIFSFYLPEGAPAGAYRDEVFYRLEQMIDYASTRNLTLLHENEKGIYGSTIQNCTDLMEHFYGKNFKATFDFANFIECKQNTLEAYSQLEPYIAYVHIKDAVRSTGAIVTAGNGDGEIPAILSKLDAKGYHGFLSLEPHLVDFEALNSLEQHVQKKGRTDGKEAFKDAYYALKQILAL